MSPAKTRARSSVGRPRAMPRDAAVNTHLLDGLIGYQLRMAMNVVSSDLMSALEPTALRPVLFAILAVVRDNRSIIQTAVGNALGIQRANLVPLLNELCDRHLLERRVAPHDKRAFALQLTGQGEKLLDDALRRIDAHESRIFGRLNARERAAFSKTLLKLARKPG